MRPLLALLAALAATPLAAERRQFGNVIYDLPPDWSQGRADEGAQALLFEGDEEACPFCALYVGAGAPAEGDLVAWLGRNALAFVEADDRGAVEVTSPPELSSTSDGRPVAIMAQRVDSDLQVLFAFLAGNRFELVAFEGWAYDDEELARTLAYLESTALPMIEGLEFASMGAEGVLPEAVPGSLDGLWWGWNQGFAMGLDMMMTPTMEFRTLAFWPDGRFYEGTPPGGLAPLDPAALAADTSWGTYREEGRTLRLAFADGRTEVLRADGDGWADDSRTLRPARPLKDGAPLDGTVSDFSYVALGPIGGDVSGGVTSSSETTFRPDGTWEGTQFGGAAVTFSQGGDATGGFASGDDGASRGTYQVRDGLLVMTPEGGGAPTISLAFVTPDGETLIGESFLDAD